MKVRRRTYLLGCTAGFASAASLADDAEMSVAPLTRKVGDLAGPLSPDLRVTRSEKSDGRIVRISASGSTYSVTVENVGVSGTLLAELYFRDNGVTDSTPAATTETHVEAGEQTELSVEADQPEWADKFGFVIRGTRFLGEVRNSGKEADVRVFLTEPPDNTLVEKTIHIGADETIPVEFHTKHRFENEYAIRAVLAET